ncbi:UvrD-helicase domain-containing protein [Suttonella ornithocola]|uniref:DNA 3'-5' helicase n=1 Tax=Suttonella ornithocola TaxID=279832 RepID=A0A380MSZ0_9GAMM|nr:UvrD-helicase domain-containing protein [Suttonella ornithocola]SUO95665.1 DNA helicase II [Suttonella ornithocola]
MEDVSELLEGLNEAQREAVTSDVRIIRVIAGAGSGKTRVLVQRMLWLMKVEGYHPASLMALTFTNKAAREMRSRLEETLQYPLSTIRMGTFHHVCGRILRQHAERMNWSHEFVVMDSEDQLRLIKRLMREVNWQVQAVDAKLMRNIINAMKEDGIRANDMPTKTQQDILVRNFYSDYESACIRQGRMDFAEMLLLTVELLEQHQDIRESFHQRYRAILVDEFQDTNLLQFRFITLMLGKAARLFVVGDDDQSIYSWRGARVENILHLDQFYPDLETIRLEQNYRSTGNILIAANGLIANNNNRLGKNLWSADKEGELIRIYPAVNEYDEARYVAEQIQRWQEAGGRLKDCAILYRNNALSRVFEEVFIQNDLPYRVTGGLRFFERAEIKDALAYLRMVLFPDDDGALERIINVPARSIGEKTVADLRSLARQGNRSIWTILKDSETVQRHFSTRAISALNRFVELIEALQLKIQENPSVEFALQTIIQDSGLANMHEKSRKEDSESRKENLYELISAGRHCDAVDADNHQRISDFLNDAALDAGDREAEEGLDAVQLMTLHTAKGLEFLNVFLIGLEEGIFPGQHNQFGEKLEEERRLAYVGITRAQENLTLSFAERRRYQGSESYPSASRFIQEIPESLLEFVRPMLFDRLKASAKADNYALPKSQSDDPFGVGDLVVHPKFGEGCVMSFEGQGNSRRALINFSAHGEKWLILSYAKLTVKGQLV